MLIKVSVADTHWVKQYYLYYCFCRWRQPYLITCKPFHSRKNIYVTYSLYFTWATYKSFLGSKCDLLLTSFQRLITVCWYEWNGMYVYMHVAFLFAFANGLIPVYLYCAFLSCYRWERSMQRMTTMQHHDNNTKQLVLKLAQTT